MKFTHIRTNAPGMTADSVGSGNPVRDDCTGCIPASANRAGRVNFVGDTVYRLARTTPTA